MDLWLDAFGDVGWIFETLNEGTADRKLAHTLIAEEGGKIVGAVDVFMREVRDERGEPVKIGGIGSVATHKDYRRMGISGQLLLNAIDLMEREGCGWSMLFASYVSHYGRYGWEQIQWKAIICHEPELPHAPPELEIVALGNGGSWPLEEMARVYDSFNAVRPLTHIRSKLYWEIPIRVRLERPDRRTWIARRNGRCVAYLVLKPRAAGTTERPEIVEYGFLPRAEEDFANLIGSSLINDVGREVVIQTPFEPTLLQLIDRCFAHVRFTERFGPMVRAISPDWSVERIRALTNLDAAQSWDLDGF